MNLAGVEIIFNMRGKMAVMQQQIEQFVRELNGEVRTFKAMNETKPINQQPAGSGESGPGGWSRSKQPAKAASRSASKTRKSANS